MTDPAQPTFHPSPTRPHLRLPPNACDAHCHVIGPAREFALVDLLGEIAPSASALHALMVDNPQRLYGFPVALRHEGVAPNAPVA